MLQKIPTAFLEYLAEFGADPYPHLDRLASLCAPCHNTKTRSEQLGEKDWLIKGCDAFGYPLDPRHPWNKAR